MRTLVRRPKGSRVTILRQELLEFFNWNHCAAHLAHALERKTAALIEQMEDRGETEGLLWIQVTEESLFEDMLRAYSTKTIRANLKEFEGRGLLLSSKEAVGRVKNYLYNYDLVDDCVGRSVRFSSLEPIGNISHGPSEIFPTNFRQISQNRPLYPYSVLQGQEQVQETTTPPYRERQNQNPIRPTLEAEYEDLDSDEGFISPPSPPQRKRLWGTKPKDPVKEQRRLEREAARQRLKGMATTEAGSSQAPSRDPGRLSSATPLPEINFPGIWNGIVTRSQVHWLPSQEGRLGQDAFRDPEFVSQFAALCRKCQELHEAFPEDMEWLTFRWILGSKQGRANWYRVLSGEFDWKIRKAKPREKKVASVQGALALLAKEIEERKKKNETRTEGSDPQS